MFHAHVRLLTALQPKKSTYQSSAYAQRSTFRVVEHATPSRELRGPTCCDNKQHWDGQDAEEGGRREWNRHAPDSGSVLSAEQLR
jgi:hypothetical protein